VKEVMVNDYRKCYVPGCPDQAIYLVAVRSQSLNNYACENHSKSEDVLDREMRHEEKERRRKEREDVEKETCHYREVPSDSFPNCCMMCNSSYDGGDDGGWSCDKNTFDISWDFICDKFERSRSVNSHTRQGG
jgi:hypothetical protein